MDIFAHTFWTAAGAIATRKRFKKPLRIKLAALYGIFPDLFAFTLLFLWVTAQLFLGNYTLSTLPNPSEFEPLSSDTFTIFRMTWVLYSLSHSIVVFCAVSIVVFLIKRRVVWEMLGWAFHICIDLFTHSYSFYPTPILWPLSAWRFNGIPWDLPWFMAVNYLLLAMVYAYLYRKKLRMLGAKLRAKSFALARAKNK